MWICFYFVLFFTAKCLNFCCEECCEDCCCDWWYNLWKDCDEKSNKEEEDFLNDYKKKAKQKDLQNIEEIKKQKEEIGKQKEELKNKIRRYLNHIKNNVENINNKLGEDNSTKEDLFNQISKINELIENFKEDEYFERNSIENIQKDLEDLQDLCRNAGIISLDVFYKENEKWKKFLEYNRIQEEYEYEKNITEDIFSLDNTLEKLKNNFGTYLLEIFKTRLFPTDKNEDKYKNEFMEFYKKYNIATWISSLTEESFTPFYNKICEKTSNSLDDDINGKCRNLLLADKYLGFALLSDGDEDRILNAFCNNIDSFDNMKVSLISIFIDCFKRNIVEIIKDSLQEQLNVNKNFQKNNSENIKNTASRKYNEAIKDLGVEKIELTFFNRYDEIGSDSFPKKAKLSVLFDYVLSKGRDFYAKDDNNRVDEETPYLTYEKEKERIELKAGANLWGDSLNRANENITIEKFYEKNKPQVFIFFKSNN